VAWNCVAKTYVVQQPPGAANWMIGCTGTNVPTPRPFDSSPTLPLGISDSHGTPVTPRSLYLAQLAERLGPQAVKNIGYSGDEGSQPVPGGQSQDGLATRAKPPEPLDPVPSASQSWRSPAEVDRTTWQHWLTIVVPKTVSHDTALLYISSGSNEALPAPAVNP
jgi:hypothetical protein